MSPERLKGDPYTSDTDLWSLGLTLLECAMGKYPIEYIAGGKKNLTFWDVYEIVKDRTIFVPDEFSAEFKDFILTW
jgi:mitogen-activated protein kinase kinase 1